MDSSSICFIGGGNMATALIAGLIARGQAPGSLSVVEVHAPARERLAREHGVAVYPEPTPEALAADVLLLAVKPQQLAGVARPLAGRLRDQLVVSIAAGVRAGDLSRWLNGHPAVVRAMPNTPAMARAGVTALYALSGVSEDQRWRAAALLGAVGKTLWLDDEAAMDAVTAVSGSGPAYVFHFIEALEAAARDLGLPPEEARLLSVETVLGAATLAAQASATPDGDDPVTLRQKVTSKGGTTERALAVLTEAGWAETLSRAARAAAERSRELGDVFAQG